MVEPLTASHTVTGRVFAVLDSFDSLHRRQSLAAISRRTGLPLTTVHRLVHELEKHAALVRGADRDYEIGSKIWRLGTLSSVHVELREVALPYMEDVYELGNDAVQVAVLDGLRCLVVDRIAGSRTISVLSKPGSRLPLHATGVGKVLLAFGGAELQDAVLGSLDRYTDQTITDAATLRSQLSTITSQGFAITGEELAPGAISVAVPLRGKGGAVIAALGVVSSSDNTAISRMVPVLQITAAAISKKLAQIGLGEASRLRAE
ncbi:IclR family transcriptional regulator [Microcella pacifica]|uniref:IclR family transcriptional regulator n=1 Tax=Microcella pacifica TaxID=2591847 RepID=A0A9E5JQT9_9MICO|nr:IclR family transcriptional regulator [Microcella pacifica]NHF64134.1 IclR family transcriptional regulator [Microcella pacifica]